MNPLISSIAFSTSFCPCGVAKSVQEMYLRLGHSLDCILWTAASVEKEGP
jgi:hypothetical protein